MEWGNACKECDTGSGTAVPKTNVHDIMFPKPFGNHTRGTTNPGINCNGLDRTVEGTGSALHAGITVIEHDLFPVWYKHLMRTDFNAPAAADAAWCIQFQSYNAFEITKVIHIKYRPTANSSMLTTSAPPMAGRPKCISFFTPEREV